MTTATFKAPDRRGPRFRVGWKKLLTMRLHKTFIKKFPEHKGLSFAQFKNIIKTFNANMVQGVIENRTGVDLPERLGCILMISCGKPKDGAVDMGASIKAGKVVKHMNWDSHQRLMKIIYSNNDSRYVMKNKIIWYFHLSRDNKKLLSKGFSEYPTKYIQIHSSEKLKSVLDREMKKHRIGNRAKAVPTHEEFDMN